MNLQLVEMLLNTTSTTTKKNEHHSTAQNTATLSRRLYINKNRVPERERGSRGSVLHFFYLIRWHITYVFVCNNTKQQWAKMIFVHLLVI